MSTSSKRASDQSRRAHGRESRPAELEALGRGLVHWYEREARDLPWRKRLDEPYAVWVAETMLQQTQAASVGRRYEEWMGRYPTLGDLARSDLDQVLVLWQGLGYYGRAARLHAAARRLVLERHGQLPCDLASLMRLEGVGPYTAAAIMAIAFNQPEPAIDGNARRVLARVCGERVASARRSADARLAAVWRAMVPPGGARDFAQALMDLGSFICTPAAPRCVECPIARGCEGYRSGAPGSYGPAKRVQGITAMHHVAVVVRCGSDYAVRHCPAGALWAGLWEFPRAEIEVAGRATETAHALTAHLLGPTSARVVRLLTVRHRVTRYAATLFAYYCEADRRGAGDKQRDIVWRTLDGVMALPMSSPMNRIRNALALRLVGDEPR